MKKSEIKNNLLEDLNGFMKKFGIDEISFGNRHKLKKTKGKKANSIVKKSINKNNKI